MDKIQFDQLRSDLAVTKSEIAHMRNDLTRALRIIVDGNGASLVSKVAVLESKAIRNDKREENDRTTLIASVLAFIGSIVILFLQVSKKSGN